MTGIGDNPSAQPGADPRLLPRWELIALVLGDLLVLIVFAALGRSNHGLTAVDSSFRAVLNTAMPFVIAWIAGGLFTGAYQGQGLFPVGRTILRTLITAVIAGPLGTALRAAWLEREISWMFMLVATGTISLMMVIWRLGWSRLRRLWWPELP